MNSSINCTNGDLTPHGGTENLNFTCNDFFHHDESIGVSENGEADPQPDTASIQEDDITSPGPRRPFWKEITVEPLMFSHMFALSMSGVVLQNLYIDRICRITLGYGDEICGNLSNYKEIEKEIDSIAPTYVTYRSLIEGLLPIVLSLFLGPWTDIYGTKWPMVIPLFSYSLAALTNLLLANIPSASPELLLISSVPVFMAGGLITVAMSAISYITKITTQENRSFRIAILETAWFLGSPLGTLASGVVYKYGGFSAVFGTSAAFYMAGFIYGWIFIHEEMPVIEDRDERNCCLDMFNIQAVKEMLITVFRKRSGLRRRWLLTMLVTACMAIFPITGYAQNMYLYTRTKFSWDVKEYTRYSVYDALIGISGGYAMIMLCMKIFKLPDAVIGIVAASGTVAAQYVYAFASTSWMIYLGASLKMFSGLIGIALRSMISKTVAKEEIAKVFTFMLCGEALMAMVGVPIYSFIFSHTVETFPGAMFTFSALDYFVILTSFLYLYFSMMKAPVYVQMDRTVDSSA